MVLPIKHHLLLLVLLTVNPSIFAEQVNCPNNMANRIDTLTLHFTEIEQLLTKNHDETLKYLARLRKAHEEMQLNRSGMIRQDYLPLRSDKCVCVATDGSCTTDIHQVDRCGYGIAWSPTSKFNIKRIIVFF